MRNLVSEYVSQFRQDRQKQVKLAAVLAALAVVVAGVVFWQLHNTGVAMSNEVYCGMEEHTHDDSCYKQALICGSEDPDHVHGDSCYATVLVCDLPEHTHTVDCLVDETADVETASVWEGTLPALSGIWSQDVVSVAESQLGYTESEANYILAEDGATHQGYNRYGAWYGNEYGDWDAMFASFCLNYAGVPDEVFPESSGSYAWTADLSNDGLYVDNEDFTPAAGDLVFFDGDLDGTADTVGVVVNTDTLQGTITVIEGNSNDAVEENVYNASDNVIMGFGLLPEQDLGGENIFTVEYDCDEPEYVEISGPESVLEDADLTFYVTVDLNSGYDIAEATANGEELMPKSITASEDGQIYTYEYTIENVDENMAVFLDARQVIDGSGTIGVYEKTDDTYEEDSDFTLTVSKVPTNTKISLDSPSVELTDNSSGEKVDITLDGSLYYLELENYAAAGEELAVSYLMLDDGPNADDNYTVTPYDESNEPFDMDAGILVLDSSQYVRAVVNIMPIQTETLCYIDENNISDVNSDGYTQKLVGAISNGSAQSFEFVGYVGAPVRLSSLSLDRDFYYGSLKTEKDDNGNNSSVDLTRCYYGIIAEQIVHEGDEETISYTILPTDEYEGEPIEGVSIYMVTDQVYSFDVEVTDVVNEHTEDNGDTYLWLGNEFYIDQYRMQGYDYVEGYTRSQNTLANCGVWVQLGRIREEAINGGTKNFSDYKDVSYEDMIAEGVSLEGYDSKNAASTAEANAPYGIVGPYDTKELKKVNEKYSSDPVTTTKRVTGHVGDEFTTSEVFDTNIVYMVTNEELQTDWINLGSHASDNRFRGWFYWINDYYKLNNHEDQLEYLEIFVDDGGEIRLDLDEMGQSGQGELDDYWTQVKGLYTKRNSVIKQYMLDNQSTLKNLGVGFADTAGWMQHIQLRMYSTVETVIDGEVYSGKLDLVYNEEAPYIEWDIDPTVIDFITTDPPKTNGSTVLAQDNEQETKQYEFGFYIDPDYAFDPDYVQISVKVYAKGTLTSLSGKTIEYTEDDPYVFEKTLTEQELREAYDDCPNSEGYDIAINLSDAIKQDEEENDVTLYKVWDDNENVYHSRDDVTEVTVTMERSKDNWTTYEDVPYTYYDETEGKLVEDPTQGAMVFAIEGDPTEDTWSLTVTSDDIYLTYDDTEAGGTGYYQFRIKVGSENIAEINTQTGSYTYSDSYAGLVVTNSLDEDFINITGEKVWQDAEGNPLNPDDSRIPEEIYMAVYQDDQFYDMQVVTAGDSWSFSFDNLPKWRDRNSQTPYVYTLVELEEDGSPAGEDGQILLGNVWYTVSISENVSEDEGNTTDYTVTNKLVAVSLPYTGGTGTWIFTVAGVCLIGGAAVALVYRKRRAVRS